MRRRDFLRTGAVIGLSTAIAGCNTGGNSDGNTPNDTSTPTSGPEGQTPQDTETDTDEEEQQTEEDTETAVRYFFQDETGALGHLADDQVPENYDKTITNDKTESEYEEMQTNDRDFAAGHLEGALGTTAEDMINRAEEIYNNPEQEFDVPDSYDDINFAEEDDEVTFLRALIKASQEAGVSSSGAANQVVNNIAEDAVDQRQPGFTDFKVSSVLATEPTNPNGYDQNDGAERENEWGQTFVNSGFFHYIGLLQYEKNGEEKTKYAEVTDGLNVNLFRRVIRNPEDSLYRTSLDHENVDNSRDYETGDAGTMFPEHYVTAFDYEKARELESIALSLA